MPCCDLKRHWKGVPFRITWLQVRWNISECSGPIRIQIYMGENRPCAAKWAKVRDGHSSAHLTPPSFLSLTASVIEKKKTRDGKGQRNGGGGGGWILAISTYPSVGINQETELCLSSSFFFFPVSSSERETELASFPVSKESRMLYYSLALDQTDFKRDRGAKTWRGERGTGSLIELDQFMGG